MKKLNNFSKYCLRSTLFFAVLLIVYMIVRRDFDTASKGEILQFIVYYTGPVLIFSIICTIISFIKKPIQLISLIYISAIMLGIYSTEFYLQFSAINTEGKIKKAAEERNLIPDLRKKKQVVMELSKINKNQAYPYLKIVNQFQEIMPLGLIPNKLTVYCNEVGRWFIFNSDKHGFNNPTNIWDEKIDIVALGDSFTHGACIPDNKNYVNLIRENYSNILNLGIGGNNPLSNLAALIEYALPKKPRIILWFHFAGNDLAGMMGDKNHKIFNKYLYESEFSQNLISRSGEIENKMLDFYSKNKKAIYEEDKYTTFQKFNLRHLIKLHYLRNGLGQTRNLDGQFDFKFFKEIMEKSKFLADQISSEIYFINIPTLQQAYIHKTDPNWRKTYEVVSELNIKWFDFSKEILNHKDPSSLYANRENGGHFSELGSRLMADFVLKAINLSK